MFEDVETREISPFTDSLSEGTVTCPRCKADIPLEELFLEGYGKCHGCARRVNLHIEVEDTVLSGSLWRNIPEGAEEQYR